MADGSIPLGKAIEEFLDGPSAPVGARTELARFSTLCGKQCPLFAINASEVKECVMEVKKAKDRKKRIEVLDQFFEFSKKMGWIRINLAANLVKKKAPIFKQQTSAPTRQKIQLSADGRLQIEADMKGLLADKERVIAEVALAREEGDLKENAGYHDARERLGIIEARLRESEDILARAIPVD
ncbi:MAG: hypothetical protein HOC20_10450 [Chloroflexi bacterium]|jgi:hypothetical protein|nr:hypothetical protein [Chloroflexota bacterium]